MISIRVLDKLENCQQFIEIIIGRHETTTDPPKEGHQGPTTVILNIGRANSIPLPCSFRLYPVSRARVQAGVPVGSRSSWCLPFAFALSFDDF